MVRWSLVLVALVVAAVIASPTSASRALVDCDPELEECGTADGGDCTPTCTVMPSGARICVYPVGCMYRQEP